MWSTCLSLNISAFFNILNATNSLVDFYFASLTLPNEPGVRDFFLYLFLGFALVHSQLVLLFGL